MKKDSLYPYYLIYLNNRLFEGDISKGSFSLFKISKKAFDDFKYRYENDKLFRSNIVKLCTVNTRDKKIEDILNLTIK